MSLILDALRKMEQERKAGQGGKVDIRPDVLGTPRGSTRQRSWEKPLMLVVAGIAILTAGVGGGVLFAGKKTEPVPQGARAAAGNGAAPEEIPPATVPPPQPAELSEAAMPHPAPQASRHSPVATRPPAHPILPADAPATMPAQRPAAAEQSAPPEYPGANLTVSGIAWQEERNLRRAVVNGNLVGEGAEVAGARIVEIGERRVKFSQGGRTISVSLSSSFQGR